MNIKQHIKLQAIVLLLPILCFSQNHDFELGTEISASTEVFKDFEASITANAKFQDKIPVVKSFSEELGISYKLCKGLKAGLAYEISQDNEQQGFFLNHGGSAYLRYKYDITKRWSISYRNKFELAKKGYINESSDLFPSYEDRNKIEISWSRKKYKFSPSFSVESFHPIERGSNYCISELRYSAGVNFDLKKKFELDVEYSFKQILDGKTPEYVSLFTVALSKEF